MVLGQIHAAVAQGVKPSDNPLKVREFETRHLFVLFLLYVILFVFSFFFYMGGGALCVCFFFGNTPLTCLCFPFFFYMGRWQLHREGVEACGGVQKGSVNGLGKFIPLWRRG